MDFLGIFPMIFRRQQGARVGAGGSWATPAGAAGASAGLDHAAEHRDGEVIPQGSPKNPQKHPPGMVRNGWSHGIDPKTGDLCRISPLSFEIQLRFKLQTLMDAYGGSSRSLEKMCNFFQCATSYWQTFDKKTRKFQVSKFLWHSFVELLLLNFDRCFSIAMFDPKWVEYLECGEARWAFFLNNSQIWNKDKCHWLFITWYFVEQFWRV